MTDLSENRRGFLKQSASWAVGIYLGTPLVSKSFDKVRNPSQPDPLLDWSDWEKYRTTVKSCFLIWVTCGIIL